MVACNLENACRCNTFGPPHETEFMPVDKVAAPMLWNPGTHQMPQIVGGRIKGLSHSLQRTGATSGRRQLIQYTEV